VIGSRRSRLFLRVGWREFHENGRVDFWVRDRDVALLFLASVEMGAANAKLNYAALSQLEFESGAAFERTNQRRLRPPWPRPRALYNGVRLKADRLPLLSGTDQTPFENDSTMRDYGHFLTSTRVTLITVTTMTAVHISGAFFSNFIFSRG